MKISNFKRIVKENFKPDYGDLVDGLGLSLNSFAESVINALSSNLNDDNINQSTVSITFSVDSSGRPKTTTSFKAGVKNKIDGLIVIKLENVTNSSAYPTTSPFITYSENNGVITINHITGLTADNKYNVKIKVLGT